MSSQTAKMTREDLLRATTGKMMQKMRPLAEDTTRVRCFCCEQTLSIADAGRQFYGDFKGAMACYTCGKRQPLESDEQLARFFSVGFPKCCLVEMVWLTQYEMEKELP